MCKTWLPSNVPNIKLLRDLGHAEKKTKWLREESQNHKTSSELEDLEDGLVQFIPKAEGTFSIQPLWQAHVSSISAHF